MKNLICHPLTNHLVVETILLLLDLGQDDEDCFEKTKVDLVLFRKTSCLIKLLKNIITHIKIFLDH